MEEKGKKTHFMQKSHSASHSVPAHVSAQPTHSMCIYATAVTALHKSKLHNIGGWMWQYSYK